MSKNWVKSGELSPLVSLRGDVDFEHTFPVPVLAFELRVLLIEGLGLALGDVVQGPLENGSRAVNLLGDNFEPREIAKQLLRPVAALRDI